MQFSTVPLIQHFSYLGVMLDSFNIKAIFLEPTSLLFMLEVLTQCSRITTVTIMSVLVLHITLPAEMYYQSPFDLQKPKTQEVPGHHSTLFIISFAQLYPAVLVDGLQCSFGFFFFTLASLIASHIKCGTQGTFFQTTDSGHTSSRFR